MGRFLQALYPGSALIVVVRHPVAVALSNKKWRRFISMRPGKFQSLAMMVDHWVTAHDVLAQDAPHLKRLLIVHYERLVRDPEPELARVQEFLGLDQPIDSSAMSTSHGDPYSERWDEYRAWWRPGGWQRRLIERRYGDRIREYGYDTSTLSSVAVPAGRHSLNQAV
jgi:hypothetical protein